jgi:hypothetical protein
MIEMRRCRWLSKLSAIEKSQGLRGECLAYGVQYHDQEETESSQVASKDCGPVKNER